MYVNVALGRPDGGWEGRQKNTAIGRQHTAIMSSSYIMVGEAQTTNGKK